MFLPGKAVKQPELADTIPFGGRIANKISSLVNEITTSEVFQVATRATGHPVRCSTELSKYFSSCDPCGKGPANPIENVSNNPVYGVFQVVQYLRIGLASLPGNRRNSEQKQLLQNQLMATRTSQ